MIFRESRNPGFTIVELLVVIVVIGILAAITIVSFTGINQRATVASIQSDLTTSSKQLKLYHTLYGYYPALDAGKCPTAPSTLDAKYCLKASGVNSYLGYTANSTFFYVMSKNGTTCYDIDSDSAPALNPTCVAKWVAVGDQIWAGSNLNVGTRVDSTSTVCGGPYDDGNGGSYYDYCAGGNQTNNAIIEKYCYDNLESNCTTYGGLYQWDEMMQYVITEGTQGVCPAGSHIPTDAQWTTLISYLGGATAAYTQLKPGGSSGMNIPPAGIRDNVTGSFHSLSLNAYWWSSSPQSASSAWLRYFYSSSGPVYRVGYSKSYGFSVRCLKD